MAYDLGLLMRIELSRRYHRWLANTESIDISGKMPEQSYPELAIPDYVVSSKPIITPKLPKIALRSNCKSYDEYFPETAIGGTRRFDGKFYMNKRDMDLEYKQYKETHASGTRTANSYHIALLSHSIDEVLKYAISVSVENKNVLVAQQSLVDRDEILLGHLSALSVRVAALEDAASRDEQITYECDEPSC